MHESIVLLIVAFGGLIDFTYIALTFQTFTVMKDFKEIKPSNPVVEDHCSEHGARPPHQPTIRIEES